MPAKRLDHEEIRRLAQRGLTYTEIAHHMSTSPATISNIMCKKYNVHRGKKCGAPRKYHLDMQHVCVLVEKGWNCYQIGEEMNCPPEVVRKRLRGHGIERQSVGAPHGARNPSWNGGRIIDKDGYILVRSLDHPAANSGGYVREHRLVMEQHLGRYLDSQEVIHHKNRIHDDNRIENLALFGSNADHLREELAGKVPNWTEEGKQRIGLAPQKMNATHGGLGTDA